MRTLATLLLAAVSTSGCASPDIPTSGWLGDYSGFEESDEGSLVQIVASDETLARYRRVRVDRVQLYLAPGSEGRSLPPSDRRVLAQLFEKALEAELGAHYELVQDLGLQAEDVLRVRAAITDLQPAETDDGGDVVELGNATVEVEIVDSMTADRLAAAVSRKHASRVLPTIEERLAEAERIFAEWAVDLRVWLDGVTGK